MKTDSIVDEGSKIREIRREKNLFFRFILLIQGASVIALAISNK